MWLHIALDPHHSVSHFVDCFLLGVFFKHGYTDWVSLQLLQVAFSGVHRVNDSVEAAATVYYCLPRGEVLITQRREFNRSVEQYTIHQEVIKLLPDSTLFHHLLAHYLRFLDVTLPKDHLFFVSSSATSTAASSET